MKENKYKDMPPFHRIKRGYQVMFTCDYGWCCENGKPAWSPVLNSWGSPYTFKGFAINRAMMMYSRFSACDMVYTYVLEQASGDIVWSSWDDIRES